MSIRNVIKALIVHDGQILLNRRVSSENGAYYALPGGGQIQYETMEEALVRECLEETGYLVRPLRFMALYEEIAQDPDLRKRYPDYTHQVYHVFLCQLESEAARAPTEEDQDQVGCEWVGIEDLQLLDLRPAAIRDSIAVSLRDGIPLFLGSERSP